MSFGKLKVEKSPTGMCACVVCEGHIDKGTMRLVETKGAGKWQRQLRYCTPCAKKRMAEIRAEIDSLEAALFPTPLPNVGLTGDISDPQMGELV